MKDVDPGKGYERSIRKVNNFIFTDNNSDVFRMIRIFIKINRKTETLKPRIKAGYISSKPHSREQGFNNLLVEIGKYQT